MDKEIPHLKKRISEYEEKIQEQKDLLSKNGNNLSASPKNENNFPNSQPEKLNDKTLLQYFQKNNVKSIKLESNKLIIEYNGKSQKETKEINNQELEKIKSFAEKLGKNELTLQDLEQSSNNNSANSPEKSNKVLYIGLSIVGVLVMVLFTWLLVRNKKK